MSRQKVIAAIGAIVVGTTVFGCRVSETAEPLGRSEAIPSREMKLSGRSETTAARKGRSLIGTANPSAVYCIKLGYKYKTVLDNEGNQYGLCVFPDGNACRAWDFYRGKCNQECSYCKQHGYDLKDLRRNEGWSTGAVCIDRNTSQEVGSVFDLMDMNVRVSP